MADDEDRDVNEEEEEEEEKPEEKKKEDPPKPEISEAELAMEKMRKKKEEEEAMWAEYIEQRKIQKQKEEEELRKLKERQVKRKERRKEEEKKLLASKKQQEAQRIKEMEEKKAKEAEAKKKRLEEAEKKREAMQAALQKNKLPENVTPNFVITKRNEDGSFDKLPTSLYMKAEMAKTKEQLQEDKKIALGVRVKPLNIEGLNPQELKSKAQELWEAIVRLESEKYDLEERRKRQEYDLKELSERQRQINRSKALKKGLDPDALSGKHPPMINVASKYERRLDRRNFTDKKSLFEGGYISHLEAQFESEWENKTKSFKDRGPSKLIKWDPNAARNKEKQEITESIEEEDDLGENPYLTDKQETDEVAEEEEEKEEGEEE